ncbi:MAG: type II toxin-antitoxin system RelE/ParE family toxin [Elusimicrobiota bacterium]
MYKAFSLPKFESQLKKLHAKEQFVVGAEIKRILADPTIGEMKRGPLKGIHVHKFKVHHQLYLLAYEMDAKSRSVYLYALASHENFYKALERYVR